jgi:hypothetical protein
MPSSSPRLRRFVNRALVDATGAAEPDCSQIAAAFTSLCTRLRQRLQPLFGTTAVAALFARGLHVAALEFAWLPEIVGQNGEARLADGTASVAQLDVRGLQDGLAAALADTIGLLCAFIGEELVLPFVQEAWGTATLAEDQRTEGAQ